MDWKAALMPKSEPNGAIFHNRIFDLSLWGAEIYSKTDIYTEKLLLMLIETPLPYGKLRKAVIGIECTLCNSLFSEGRQQFHAGVQFLRFRGIDKHLLAEALFTQKESISKRTHRISDSSFK
ncbi:MAG: hypothetical protein KGL01_06130 [Betaproteobacteria bacterium]|nr:hypothetical protein [Betaproteobacteria bacterium]